VTHRGSRSNTEAWSTRSNLATASWRSGASASMAKGALDNGWHTGENWHPEHQADRRVRVNGRAYAAAALLQQGRARSSRVDRRADVVRAAEDMLGSAGVEIIWWPMTGGGGPWSIFANEFGIPILRDIGLGHGRASSTDEYLVIEGSGRIGGMVEMALSHAEFMLRMGVM
jgi:hypothetical protein